MNKFKLETHDNSKEYFKSITMESNALYVMDNTSLTHMLVTENEYFNENKSKVIAYEDFFNSLFPHKLDLAFQKKLKEEVKQVIGTLVLVSSSEEVQELQAIIKNIEELNIEMDKVMLFGLGTINIEEKLSLGEKLFIKIYDGLLQMENWKIVHEKYNSLNSYFAIEEKIKGFTGSKINKIYFYNFTEISTSKYIVFQMLRFTGCELVFKAPYFNGLKNTNTWFNKLYSEGFDINIEASTNYEDKASLCKYIAYIEEKELPDKDNYNIQVIRYNSIGKFKEEASKYPKVISFTNDKIQGYSIDHMESLNFEKKLLVTDMSLKAYEEYIIAKKKDYRFIKLDFIEKISKGNELVQKGIQLEKLSMDIVEDYLKFTLVNSLIHVKGNFIFSWIRNLRTDDSEGILFSQLKAIYGSEEDSEEDVEIKDDVKVSFNESDNLSEEMSEELLDNLLEELFVEDSKFEEDLSQLVEKSMNVDSTKAVVCENNISYDFFEGIELSPNQIEIVHDETEQILIHGLAGTGKSITLIYKFISTLIKEEKKKVLLVTFNSNLITDIKKRLEVCEEFNLNREKHEVHIATFHEMGTEILHGNKIINHGLEYINSATVERNRDIAFRRITAILHKYREDINAEYTSLLPEERLSRGHKEGFIIEEIFWMKANGLVKLEDYLNKERRGRRENVRLTMHQRKTVFKIFEEYEKQNKEKFTNHLDLEDYALRIIENIDLIKHSYKYDYIFVDEYQDLDPMQIKALSLLTNKSIVMAGDQKQRIYNKSPLSYEELGLNLLHRDGIKNLSKTFRSTKEIIRLANSLNIQSADYYEDESSYHKHGEKPTIYAGRYKLALNFVVKEIKSILEQKPNSRIAIIHREDAKENLTYARSNQQRYMETELLTVFLTIDNYNKKQAYNNKNIVYTDTYNVKGMEFDVVFIIDFTRGCYPNAKKVNKVLETNSLGEENKIDMEAAINLEKKLLYVAMTRAKEKLYLVSSLGEKSKPSVFLGEFDKKDYIKKGEFFTR